MEKVFEKPVSIDEKHFSYCAGCTHGIIHRLIAESIDELGIRERTVGVSPVGCAVFAYEFFNFDCVGAAHGRAPAVATGIKRSRPDCIVFTYQGDGDLAAIGTAEIVHAATRGEKITVIFVNNAIYGMTGGQMAPTTLIGQYSETTPYGRKAELHGFPIKVSEMLSTLEGAQFIQRVTVMNPASVIKAKQAIKKAFKNQVDGKGFNLVEILSTCPSCWGMAPLKALDWLKENMIPVFPLGVYKDRDAGEAAGAKAEE
ncbi:MAG: thiamine pyrophosphate-dependent enzyme [Candidatus Eremiobacteraeota bacterium]|nr:thiamine pyrophosphate-dependent enzyme [Candidatus Eremiobacteraeota bacterium]